MKQPPATDDQKNRAANAPLSEEDKLELQKQLKRLYNRPLPPDDETLHRT